MIKSKDLRSLRDSSTLDLAFYEIGNAILQELKMGIIDQKTSSTAVQVLQSLPSIMSVVHFEDLKAEKVLDTAKKLERTFYDAAYVVWAKENNDALVTDDGPLARAASRLGIKTYSASDRLHES
jgi:predicted nucleic acid-binding protein